MYIVAPFGFYGWGNIGDEATLNGFARLLAQGSVAARVRVGSRDPGHTARVEPAFRYFSVSRRDPRRWWAKLRASAHAVIGGTPIMDVLGRWPLCDLEPLVRSTDRWKVPMVFIGVGIESLRSAESRSIVSKEIVPRVRHWSVRSDCDRQRLTEYGASPDHITVAADMAWLIEPATPEFGRGYLRANGVDPHQRLIGVNVVNENFVLDREAGMVDALALALEELADQLDARIVFLANEIRDDAEFDRMAAERVRGRMKDPHRAVLAANTYLAPREMMSIVSCCDLTISMRYHFCLFSALQKVPFIAIPRSDKIADLCWDLGWRSTVMPPALERATIVDEGVRLHQDASLIRSQLSKSVGRMSERAKRNLDALEALAPVGRQPSGVR